MIAPGTTDAYAWWVAGDSGIVIAAVYVIRGPVPGLATLAADLAALLAGLLVTGGAIAAGAWLAIVISPVIGAGLAVGVLAAFRSLSRRTESQLAEYGERLRRQARAEAMSRVDSAALENARRVAGPVLDVVASGQTSDANLRMASALASATLRDELLAPGFLTAGLAERVRAVRTYRGTRHRGHPAAGRRGTSRDCPGTAHRRADRPGRGRRRHDPGPPGG